MPTAKSEHASEPEATTRKKSEPEPEEVTKPEDATISPPGEYPEEGIFGYITEEG